MYSVAPQRNCKVALVQIAQLRASYMPEAVEMASAWRRNADSVLPFKMQWAVATT